MFFFVILISMSLLCTVHKFIDCYHESWRD